VDWKAKVDLFEQLRREHEFGVGTIAGVAAKFGVHRRLLDITHRNEDGLCVWAMRFRAAVGLLMRPLAAQLVCRRWSRPKYYCHLT
jgi:hypothetical protein